MITIKDSRYPVNRLFSELDPGETFIHSGHVCLKVSETHAVVLGATIGPRPVLLREFDAEDAVTRVDIDVVIRKEPEYGL